jgi:hypothetical protein
MEAARKNVGVARCQSFTLARVDFEAAKKLMHSLVTEEISRMLCLVGVVVSQRKSWNAMNFLEFYIQNLIFLAVSDKGTNKKVQMTCEFEFICTISCVINNVQ